MGVGCWSPPTGPPPPLGPHHLVQDSFILDSRQLLGTQGGPPLRCFIHAGLLCTIGCFHGHRGRLSWRWLHLGDGTGEGPHFKAGVVGQIPGDQGWWCWHAVRLSSAQHRMSTIVRSRKSDLRSTGGTACILGLVSSYPHGTEGPMEAHDSSVSPL